MLDLNKIKTAYFIGIGGIGVSALARIFLKHGIKISGSDLVASEITKDLGELGARIKIGTQTADNIKKDYDIVIYTPAIPDDHPELSAARSRKIRYLSYPEALAELVNRSFGIAVTGTHGKTTTTAMLGKVLVDGGVDPTVVVGSNLKEFK
ncbi:UDP-N-acetylmuramate--L-alanine ligase, partial [Patescibacteria group bacterium]